MGARSQIDVQDEYEGQDGYPMQTPTLSVKLPDATEIPHAAEISDGYPIGTSILQMGLAETRPYPQYMP